MPPISLLNDWLEQEENLGAPNPRQAVLATVSSVNTPHARVVAYSHEAQLRFHAYAPTSSQIIIDKQALEIKKSTLAEAYANKAIPFSLHYCGFRLTPTRFIFYTYRTDELSDVFSFEWRDGWKKSILSP